MGGERKEIPRREVSVQPVVPNLAARSLEKKAQQPSQNANLDLRELYKLNVKEKLKDILDKKLELSVAKLKASAGSIEPGLHVPAGTGTGFTAALDEIKDCFAKLRRVSGLDEGLFETTDFEKKMLYELSAKLANISVGDLRECFRDIIIMKQEELFGASDADRDKGVKMSFSLGFASKLNNAFERRVLVTYYDVLKVRMELKLPLRGGEEYELSPKNFATIQFCSLFSEMLTAEFMRLDDAFMERRAGMSKLNNTLQAIKESDEELITAKQNIAVGALDKEGKPAATEADVKRLQKKIAELQGNVPKLEKKSAMLDKRFTETRDSVTGNVDKISRRLEYARTPDDLAKMLDAYRIRGMNLPADDETQAVFNVFKDSVLTLISSWDVRMKAAKDDNDIMGELGKLEDLIVVLAKFDSYSIITVGGVELLDFGFIG